MFDEDDMQNNLGEPTLKDLFNIATIDKQRNLKIHMKLVDEEGDEVPIKEAVNQLMSYIEDTLKQGGENNYILNKLAPLAAQSMMIGLPQLLGDRMSMLFLSMDNFRLGLSHMMLLSYVFIKWIQDKKLKIVTVEEPITTEQIESSMRLSRISNAAVMGQLLGLSPQEIMKQLVDAGDLSAEEVESYFHSDESSNDSDYEQ